MSPVCPILSDCVRLAHLYNHVLRVRVCVCVPRTGESEFLQALMPNGFPEDLQPIGNCGHDVLVYHNGYLAKTHKNHEERHAHKTWERDALATVRPFCKADGW